MGWPSPKKRDFWPWHIWICLVGMFFYGFYQANQHFSPPFGEYVWEVFSNHLTNKSKSMLPRKNKLEVRCKKYRDFQWPRMASHFLGNFQGFPGPPPSVLPQVQPSLFRFFSFNHMKLPPSASPKCTRIVSTLNRFWHCTSFDVFAT